MQKSLDIFKALPQSVFDVLCDKKNTGFYMPAYQRPYSWEEEHIRDLFSDCESVFRNLLESSDAIIFLGSILTVDDSAAKTIYPINKSHTPTHIKLIIDGQQRLSTLLLIVISLNERLRLLLPMLKKHIESNPETSDALENLREIVSQVIIDTSNFVIETQAKHLLYKNLPKIIRSQVDCWGKDDQKAKYESPIAELLITYQRHVIEHEGSVNFKELELSSLSSSSKRIVSNIKEIRKQLDYIQNGFHSKNRSDDDEDKLSLNDFVDVKTLDTCLDFPIEQDLYDAAHGNDKISEIVLIALFTKFLLHRVCLTYVEVNNESYAFDMFEALNTTGEPLTAIETFVPKVIEHIGSKRNEGEPGTEQDMQALHSITDRFESIIKSKDKNDKTKALILTFIRAYQGKVKVTRLRDQRDAMLNSYEQCMYGNKDEYLKQLAKTAEFLFDYWQVSTPDVSGLVHPSDKDVANVCLRYLVDINHDIVQALLVQFILQDEKYEAQATEHSSFLQALKAVTAFSVLWRAMSGGADGIDSIYRKLHEKGFDISGKHIRAYQLKNSSLTSEEFNINDVKVFFKQELENKIIAKGSLQDKVNEKWIDISSKQPLLTRPKNIKLLILAGIHNIKLVKEGFVRCNDERTQFITPMMWSFISSKNCIKKIYNGSNSPDWSDSKIKDPEVFNRLGNVLIDPKDNISTSLNISWYDLKQNMLQALSDVEDSLSDIDMILKTTSNISDEAKRRVALHLLESKYEDIVFADEWNKEAIDQRTYLLLSNAWENLISWLS